MLRVVDYYSQLVLYLLYYMYSEYSALYSSTNCPLMSDVMFTTPLIMSDTPSIFYYFERQYRPRRNFDGGSQFGREGVFNSPTMVYALTRGICIVIICLVFTLNFVEWSSTRVVQTQNNQSDPPLRKSSNDTSSVQEGDQELLRQPTIGSSNPGQTAESYAYSSTSTTLEKSRSSRTKNSFFTLLAGINPYEPKPLSHRSSYLGYLLHMATIRYMVDESGSKMDFNVLIRIQNGLNNTIPESQSTFFSKLRMKIEYLPQDEDDSWKSFTTEKFQIL